MQIKAASRGFSLSIIFICTLVVCGCISLFVVLFTFNPAKNFTSTPATAIIAIVLFVIAWMIYCIRICLQIYWQYPYFKIDIEPSVMTIRNQSNTIVVRASDVATYYIYNNKVRFVLREEAASRDMPPFASLKGKQLTISLNKLDRHIPVRTWLHKFDSEFDLKSKTNLGMIAQALGYGLS